MKLLTEYISFDDIQMISEKVEGAEGKKNYFLKGPFLQADVKNRNGRKYMQETLEREVKDFYETKIVKKRSMGELDHPPEPTLNLDRVSHIITDLKMDGNTGYGCAKLLNTPMGMIAKALVDDGVQLGMSTRGVGTLDGDQVKDDYKLITVDIVADPSAPTAFVEGILENKEFIVNSTGDIVEAAVQQLKASMDKSVREHKYDRSAVSEASLEHLFAFMESMK